MRIRLLGLSTSLRFHCLLVWLLLIPLSFPALVGADERTGRQIYRQECARCHGADGQGTKKVYPKPLAGLRSLDKLTAYIAKTMPEDDPGQIKLPEATKVAAYIFDAFYSPEAQARLKPPRLELSRLTVPQYRNAFADLVGGYRAAAPAVAGDGTGLRGEYFKGKNRGGRKSALDRLDPVIQVDLGASSPDGKKLDANQFFVRWEGSVLAPETGEFEFQLRTDQSARLWVNDNKQPLIDASVKSGNGTEYAGSIYLLAGRLYPLRLEFFRSTLGVQKEDKAKGPPPSAKLTLEWKRPHRVFEPVAQRFLYPERSQPSLVVRVPLPPDDRSAGYERGTAISKAWVEGTTEGAIEATRYIFANLQELSGVSASAADRKAKLRDFCRGLAERAFRRSLTPTQQKAYIEHPFETAPDVDTAVKRSLLLVFQSPWYLYRELPAVFMDKTAGYDSASRISFGLLDSMPDAELRRAAGAGELSTQTQVARQAERLVKDVRFRTKIHQFLLQWLKVEQVGDLTKDVKRFPDFDLRAAVDLRASLELFLDETIHSPAADFRQLLLADYLYLNGRLAKFYKAGLPADAPFQKVAFRPDERCGVLTHPYLMATFAYPADSSPIHRGVFLARGVLGVPLRPPSNAFVPLAAELHPNLTTRERVSLQTRPQACQACHGIINPLGFIFEKYDAIGSYRNQEKGRDIDPSGSYQTRDGKVVHFSGVRDFAQFLSKSDEVQEAFVAQLFHHLVRQPVRAFGPTKLTDLRRFFVEHDCNIRTLAVEIIAQTALLPKEETAKTAGN